LTQVSRCCFIRLTIGGAWLRTISHWLICFLSRRRVRPACPSSKCKASAQQGARKSNPASTVTSSHALHLLNNAVRADASINALAIETFKRSKPLTTNSTTIITRREEMTKKIWLKYPMLAALMICLMSVSAWAQSSRERGLTCNDRWNDRPSHCEIREQILH